MVSPTSPAKAPLFAIVIHEKGGAERRESFDGTEISVGRVQGNELMLPKGNVSKRHARLLYRDMTPPPTAEEVEMRRLERIYRATTISTARPTRDQRRARRKLTGKD